jgi:hypothetical protein
MGWIMPDFDGKEIAQGCWDRNKKCHRGHRATESWLIDLLDFIQLSWQN